MGWTDDHRHQQMPSPSFKTLALLMGWTDDHKHRQVPNPSFKTKSYLQDGPMTTNTNECLVLNLKLSPTCGMDR